MKLRNVLLASKLWGVELFRRRFVLLLILVIPVVFYLVAFFTLPADPIPLKLGAVKGNPSLIVKQQDLGMIYIGLAANGLIASFLALSLMQKNQGAKKRLILCGYRTGEILASIFLVTLLVVITTAIFVGSMLLFFMDPKDFPGVIAGFILCGFVYGNYGILIGSLIRNELEGILFIVLLANIDVGWLQNPIYYYGAQTKEIIEWLPAFYPSQTSVIHSFTDLGTIPMMVRGFIYGMIFLLLGFLFFWIRAKHIKKSE